MTQSGFGAKDQSNRGSQFDSIQRGIEPLRPQFITNEKQQIRDDNSKSPYQLRNMNSELSPQDHMKHAGGGGFLNQSPPD